MLPNNPSSLLKLVLVGALVAAAILVPTTASASQGFMDDDESAFETDIEAIANVGITLGCNPPENTLFCPEAEVSRGQMAAFLVRAFGYTETGGVDFVDDEGSVFEADIQKLAAAGITLGCNPPTNNQFCPNTNVSRGQMAAFLTRALNLTDTGGIDFVDDDGSVFEEDIEKLAAAGITLGCNPPTKDRFCPTATVTRGQMAAFLTRALDLPTKAPAGFAVTDADLPLVATYHVLEPDESNRPDVDRMQYWPRAMANGLDVDPDRSDSELVDSAGSYDGWDVLAPSTKWEYKNLAKKDDWFHFTLNRPARVGVIWRDDSPLPSWLSGWVEGGTVSIDGDLVPVLEKDFDAGEVVLGSVEWTNDWREMYVVLLSESNSNPSVKPPAPEGFTTAEANRPCPAWVHDLHVTTGPDGMTYNTWHPQVDPVYWCYFGHDHGSNPDLIPGSPKVAYAYVAEKLGEDEPNEGFKEFIFKDLDGDNWVRFVIHANTSSARRVCTQFHTLQVEVYDLSGDQRFSAAYKADYGAAFATSDGGGEVLNPTNCGYSMASLANAVSDRQTRDINVGEDSENYESWDSREETPATFNLGMPQFEHRFDIRDPMSHCNGTTCNSVTLRADESATRRTLDMATWRSDFVFDSAHALEEGEYFTDPFGLSARTSGASDAVRQYAEPGFSLGFYKNVTADRVECVAFEPWKAQYVCYQIGGAGNRSEIPSPPEMMIETAIWRN